jgi:fructose-bisphosphate aldolase class 1
MDERQLHKVRFGKGFIAALDQSGGSTPRLAQYGIAPEAYSGDAEMFALMHRMRSRIITSRASRATTFSARSSSRTRWTARSRGATRPSTSGP